MRTPPPSRQSPPIYHPAINEDHWDMESASTNPRIESQIEPHYNPLKPTRVPFRPSISCQQPMDGHWRAPNEDADTGRAVTDEDHPRLLCSALERSPEVIFPPNHHQQRAGRIPNDLGRSPEITVRLDHHPRYGPPANRTRFCVLLWIMLAACIGTIVFLRCTGHI